MLRKGIFKSLIQLHLLEIFFNNHSTKVASSDESLVSEHAGDSENPEFENCIQLIGDISDEDSFLDKAINQLFIVS